jgi:hypothetical protein
VVSLSAAELLPILEAAVTKRFERDLAPLVRCVYRSDAVICPPAGIWANAPLLPFAAAFADPAASPFKGAAATFQGLLPLSHGERTIDTGNPCISGTRCDPLFVRWTGGTLTGPGLFNTSCAVTTTSYTSLQCTYYYAWPLLGGVARNEPFTLTAVASNVGMALRRLNTAANGMTNVNAAGRAATGSIGSDGSATIVLTGTTPVSSSGTVVGDLFCTLGLGELCRSSTITVPIFLLADHPLLDSNDAATNGPGWFLRNRWHEVAYYALAPGVAPSGVGSCTSSTTCLNVTYHPSDGKQRGLIVIAGRSLSGTTRPNGSLVDWLEGTNADGDATFTLRAPALRVNKTFNDRIAVVDGN